jgi:hypothetical protein
MKDFKKVSNATPDFEVLDVYVETPVNYCNTPAVDHKKASSALKLGKLLFSEVFNDYI